MELEGEDGVVKVLVGKTHSQFVQQENKDVFVFYYDPWCSHCENF
jgi:hypothetical protein